MHVASSLVILAAISFEGCGAGTGVTRARVVCKLRLLPGSKMAAILLEDGAKD